MPRFRAQQVRDPRFRGCVADAVHHAVTTFTGDDGMGHCDLYALAGSILLRELTGDNYQPQVGSLMFLADPAGNGWLEIRATDGGLDRLEFHAWIGLPGQLQQKGVGGEPDRYGIGALVDLSTRHLRTMVKRLPWIKQARRLGDGLLLTLAQPEDPIEWTRPDDPPPYVWVEEIPDDFRYEVDEEATRIYYEDGLPAMAVIASLRRDAFLKFGDLWKIEPTVPVPRRPDPAVLLKKWRKR